ncbi:DUF6231 family protein [Marinimicrobium sp. ARAG 43.8]|uniref:DUF6231 family protein n=1 Tax=Marinimicrobium sp. ARAG 43.8 TaxID=3418719 RepID=UPI003CE69895
MSESTSTTDPDQALAALITRCEPSVLMAFGERAQALAQQWQQVHEECALTLMDAADTRQGLTLERVQDLALISNTLEHLSRADGQALLGQLRNYGTHQIAVLDSERSEWTLSDFIALGFRRQARLDDNGEALSLYTYNIDNYNHKRDWNNPRFWANPEMWGKARW